MAPTLLLSSEELDDEDIRELTTDLCNTIIDETDINAKLADGVAQKEERGDPITLGLIVLTFISSSAAVALFNVLKSYIDRESSLVFDIQEKDGTQRRLSVKNMRPNDVKEFIEFVGNRE
jgi:hypothetical protein